MAVVPVALVLAGLAVFGLPHIVHAPAPGESGLRFFKGAEVSPEPLEQTRYLLFLLAAPAVVASSALMARLAGRLRPSPRLLLSLSICVEVVFAAAVILWWDHQQRDYPYFSGSVILFAMAAAAATVPALFWLRPLSLRLGPLSKLKLPAACAVLIAGALTAIGLLPSLFHETNVAASHLVVRVHLPFTMDEFAAVANGRSPLVDFIPQYANLLPYLFSPVFGIFGLSVGTFTSSMFVLSGASLLAVFYVFVRVSGRWGTGLLLYVPFLTLSLYRFVSEGDEHGYVANYFAAMPLRYFGPWLVAALLVWQLRRPSGRRLTLVFGVAGAAMLNNPDFGLASYLAAVGATWLAGGRATMAPAAWARYVLVRAAIGLGCAAGGVIAVTLLRTGELPDFLLSLYFARQFAVAGFYMLPMPATGFHLVIGLMLVGALVRAVFRARSPLYQGDPARLLTASLAYGALLGLGAGSYYVGRSHVQVLVILFSAWAFVLVLLMLDALTDLSRTGRPPSGIRMLWALPATLVACHLFLAVAPAWEMRDLNRQLRRIGERGRPAVLAQDELVAFVRRHADPGEKVLILAELSHGVALRAGVEDVFPYNSIRSVVTLEQLDVVSDRLRRDKVKRVFSGARPVPEVEEFLRHEGFRPGVGGNDVGQPVLWERGVDRPVGIPQANSGRR